MKGSWKNVSILALSTSLIVTGCQFSSSVEKEPEKIPKTNGHSSSKTEFIPQKITAGHIKVDKIAGWINDDEIVFTALQGTQTLLKKMNVRSGSQTTLYESPSAISSVYINPDQSRLIIHSSVSNEKAEITVLRSDGSKLYTLALPSAEIHIEWNSFNQDQFLVTTFAEDWSFRCYVVDSALYTAEELNTAQPFPQWHSKEKFLYLAWDRKTSGQSAPLIIDDISEQEKRVLKEHVIEFKQKENVLVTLEMISEDEGKYTFYNRSLKNSHSFEVPLLENASGWTLPQTGISEKKNIFAAVVPRVDEEGKDSFRLIQYNWKTGESETILKNIPNELIQLSPDADWCLIGNRLEKIINMRSKKIYNLL
ncbi:hypothetical protein JOC77_002733 [Peribacillus deserti]|uniref:YqgU-like 6-bladed beta-propeller domain-containing protein n=1 Tax=Peribacillus deserti TaxID=673318 RepID=A0ABS2QLG1_9BACI|nr:hypothetical protein [Peribacillus deserti]MBM7693293.1 hypothetical protein [Peribacillus deserti]